MVTGGPASAPQAPRLLCVPGHVLFLLCSSGLPSPLSWAFEPAAPSAARSVPSFLSLPPLLHPLPVQMSPINRPSPPTECEGTPSVSSQRVPVHRPPPDLFACLLTPPDRGPGFRPLSSSAQGAFGTC